MSFSAQYTIQDTHTCLDLIKSSLKHSDNFRAEMLRLYLLQANKKINLPKTTQLYDGSGLSKRNKTSSGDIATTLHNISSQDYFQDFFNCLPIAGIDGTLKKRFTTSSLQGQVFAKTGTLDGVKALSGYLRKGNELISFSILQNKEETNGFFNYCEDLLGAIYAQ